MQARLFSSRPNESYIPFRRNVPGVAMYMASLTQLRALMARSSHFSIVQTRKTTSTATGSRSVLPTLTSSGNLLSGAVSRVAIGFLLNPFSVLKARFESSLYEYKSVSQGMRLIMQNGPSELFRGFLASSMRDAPYAGIFLVVYEHIKRDACTSSQFLYLNSSDYFSVSSLCIRPSKRCPVVCTSWCLCGLRRCNSNDKHPTF
jgi:hypothetical protein